MSRKFYFDSQCGYESFAVTEDGVLTEYHSEPIAAGAVIGNVYKGRVTDVLDGMQAAFVDCGLEKHCYLSADNMTEGQIESDGGQSKKLNLKEGDEILVQVTRAETGKKGAKVTSSLSFVGRYTVYMPDTPFVGVSAKIDDDELRRSLIFGVKSHLKENEGAIIRTAAPYAGNREKLNEIDYFRSLYKNILSRFERAPVGELLYSDCPLYIRYLRDMLVRAGDQFHVGTRHIFDGIAEIYSGMIANGQITLTLHDGGRDMFYSEGITEQYLKTLQPKAELANGAHIVIERTEALTVIDVNTGKFTGEDSLEHTVYYTNVLATREIARQVKLRNLGGLFVVDFIDMTEEKHKKAIVAELERALKGDNGKCRVLPMSRFGLVEFTRKRTGRAIEEDALSPCKTCGGTGAVRTTFSVLTEIRARLLQILSEGTSAVCVDLNFDVAGALINNAPVKESIRALYPEARIYLVFHRTYGTDSMYFRRLSSDGFSLPEGYALLY